MDNTNYLRQELINTMYSIRADWSHNVWDRMNYCIELAEQLGEKEIMEELIENVDYACEDGRICRDMYYNYDYLAKLWELEIEWEI